MSLHPNKRPLPARLRRRISLPVLNTPLTELRPRRMTHAALVEYFRKRKYPRTITVFGNFERGEVKTPSGRFVELWAAACGTDPKTVLAAHAKTLRMRARKTGPFARRSVPPRAA